MIQIQSINVHVLAIFFTRGVGKQPAYINLIMTYNYMYFVFIYQWI